MNNQKSFIIDLIIELTIGTILSVIAYYIWLIASFGLNVYFNYDFNRREVEVDSFGIASAIWILYIIHAYSSDKK